MAHHPQAQHQHEFLPLCDVLFNIISLASYFCDVVFDFAMAYALAHHSPALPALFPLSVVLIGTSLIISQIISVRWYLWGARGRLTGSMNNCDIRREKKNGDWRIWCILLLHSTQVGVLWRYFKLFIPVNLTYVKHEVRELCVLRLVHAFCEAAPMLLLQLYLLFVGINTHHEPSLDKEPSPLREEEKLAKLTAVSAGLSLWSVCWAVASFSKGAARLRNLERLVLTWLGVLAQLGWRLGTVSARILALVTYASLYGGQWLLIVMALHWLSMLTWLLLTPDGLFHGGEHLSVLKKTSLASLLAFVYVFAYVNLHETNHRQKMVIFYTVMFLENSLLIGVWVVGVSRSDLLPHRDHPQPIAMVLTLLALFFGGMFFMGLYYRFFHVRRLRYEAGGRMTASNLTALSGQENAEEKQMEYNTEDKKISVSVAPRRGKLGNGGIPGVFNCRFAGPTVVSPNRKKKKPTSFVPPPPPQSQTGTVASVGPVNDAKQWLGMNNGSRQLIPFWKRSVVNSGDPQGENGTEEKTVSESGISGSLSVNLIREKLREKKQQQLRELRAIQEEIKEGKLFPPPSASASSFSSSVASNQQQRPPPNTKLHTSPSSPLFSGGSLLEQSGGLALASWPPVKMHCLLPPPPSSSFYPSAHSQNPWRTRERADTPEILLAPRCLPHHYCHWPPGAHVGHRLRTTQNNGEESSRGEGEVEGEMSDMEGSQVSLPRSYTLPREFKYNHPNSTARDRERRVGANKVPASRFYLPSTNSSDGDVDSADNEDETDSEMQFRMRNESHGHENRRFGYENGLKNDFVGNAVSAIPSNSYLNNSYAILRPNQLFRSRVKHETKL